MNDTIDDGVIAADTSSAITVEHSRRGDGARILLALAFGEGRRTLRHPAVRTAIGITLFLHLRMATAFMVSSPDPGDVAWIGGVSLVPLVALLFVFAHLTACRDRRNGTEELFGSLPVPARVRTGSFVAGSGWSIAAALLAMAPFSIFALLYGVPHAASDLRYLLEQLAALTLLGCILGTATGRWLPFMAAAPVGAIGLVVASTAGVAARSRTAFFGLMLGFDVLRALPWHVVYLVGLAVVAAAVALLREGMSRGPLVALAAGVAIAAMGGFLQLPDLCSGIAPCTFQ